MAKKKLTKKIKNLIKYDLLMSIAMASILLNIFFLVGVLLFNTTSKLDERIFKAAYSNLCDKNYITNLDQRMDDATDPDAAKIQFEADCLRGGFDRYYQNAIEAFYIDKE